MVIILMGVSGCGKTTVGELLAQDLNLPFYDADDFHPETNVKKMESGIPLNDDDRKPWLKELARQIKIWNENNGAVLACSALKENYRQMLRADSNQNEVQIVYLKGSKKLIADRLNQRSGHYMPPELLDSQFADLEEPENALTVSIDNSPEKITQKIMDHLPDLS
jgi:carbohydrate kinase (thermoresistant glucokinase family)